MKKILFTIIILLLTAGCSNSYLKSINLTKLTEKVENKETFVLYLTDNDTTGNTLKNTLLKVSKTNNLQTFYLNTNKLSDEDNLKLQELFTFEESNIIIFIKNGTEESVLTRIDDTYISEKDLEQELITQGYIK